ncbi:MAG: protein kinase [Polyangiaceae bacterium]|nr:protein kinase [Polyangiaceae bacterium]
MADQAQPPPREKAARRTPTPRKTPAPGVEGEDDPYVGLRILDQIEVRKPIGVGSMARVYQAFQHGVDRDVAVKILHRELSDNPDIVARFHREAQVACLLDHPNAVKVMLTSQLPAREKGAGELVLVMEYLRGRTLAEALAEGGGRLPLERALHVLVQICDVVGEAHRRGVVHRDIKPENVMLVERGDEPDFVKVLDFGIARLAAKDASYATRQGAVFGSPRYISPEGAQGMAVTPAADVYSLATLFFQCLAGRTPFEADTPVALLVAHATEEAPLLSSLPGCEKVPAPLVELLRKNLAKEAEERDPDASALGRALARAACTAGLKPDPVALRLGWLEVVADSPSRDAFSPELRARIEAGGRGSPGMTIVAELEGAPYEPGGKTTTLFDVPSTAAVIDDKRAPSRRGGPGPTVVLDEVDASGRPVSARTSGRASTTIIIDPHDDRPGIKPTSGRGVIPAVVGHSAGLAPVHTPAPSTSPPYFNNHHGDLGDHSHSLPGGGPGSARHLGGPPQGPPSQGYPQHLQHARQHPQQHTPPPPHAQPSPHPPHAQQHPPHAQQHPPHAQQHPPHAQQHPPHAQQHPSHPNHDPAFRPNAALSSTPGASLPTSPSQAPDEPRRRYGVIAAIVGIFFVFGGGLAYSVRFGLRRGGGEVSAAETLLTEVHRAEQRGAWLEPPGQNVRELLQRAQRDLPGDGRVYDLRRSLAARALELARGEREAARHAEALRFAELAREFDPANRDAGELVKALTLAPPEAVVPPAPPPVAPPTLASAPATAAAPPAPPPEALPPAPSPEASAGKAPRPPSSGRANPGNTTRSPSDTPKPNGRAGAGSSPDPWLLARVSRKAPGGVGWSKGPARAQSVDLWPIGLRSGAAFVHHPPKHG